MSVRTCTQAGTYRGVGPGVPRYLNPRIPEADDATPVVRTQVLYHSASVNVDPKTPVTDTLMRLTTHSTRTSSKPSGMHAPVIPLRQTPPDLAALFTTERPTTDD